MQRILRTALEKIAISVISHYNVANTPIKCIFIPNNQYNSVGVSCEFATLEELLLQHVTFIGMHTMCSTR